MSDEALEARATKAGNRLAKWRSHFAGWQLGTRKLGDPECDAVRDHREATILLRAEVSAITGLLIRKGIFSAAELTEAIADEADMLSADYEKQWPGVTATDTGLTYDARAAETMRRWIP